MQTEHEANRQRVLEMIESAQRAGRSEPQIVALAERYFNTDPVRPKDDTGLLSRLRKAA